MKTALAAALALSQSSPPAQEPANGARGSGGIERPSHTDVSYRFECRESATRLRYTQRERPLEEAGLQGALTVALAEFNVTGRSLSAAAREQVATLFRSWAWIEDVRLHCHHGDVYLMVRSMPTAAWASSFRQEPRQRPRTRLWTIKVDRSGGVTVS